MGKVALIAGTTGLVGSQLLELLLADDHYTRVISLTRKSLAINHPKLSNVIVDFNRLAEYSDQLKADDIFCCLGTTIKQARSQEAFKKVDFEYPLEIAKITKESGAQQYLLVTALGASKKSSFYYNRVKGEVEDSIGQLRFKSYHIFRPSFLQGDRLEKRAGEEATAIFFKAFGFLVPKKFKGIDAIKVARAMVAKAKEETTGYFIHESGSLQAF